SELPDGDDMIIKAYITGGEINDRGRYPKPDFFVIFDCAHKITPEELAHGVALRKNNLERPFPEVKSTNYLLAYIPMMFAKSADDFESLYIVNGEITESAASNFFMVLDGKLITAPVGRVLDGITRKVLLTLAEENGIPFEVRCPLECELANASEAFITGSVKEVLPIIRVGDQVIGDGKPGSMAKRMLDLYNANVHRWL
ncbi:MAG: aminotransferase class IV, partial [Synergistaceae bacterium]|nr:aminotransferase class IV [Synergistaceae bacterium]